MKTTQPASTSDLLELVRKSEIFQPGEVDERLAASPRLPADPLRAASVLVENAPTVCVASAGT